MLHWLPRIGRGIPRLVTLFHEYAHLLTRTPSACVEGTFRRASRHDDQAERWCERFASAALLPPADLVSFLSDRGLRPGQKVTDLDLVRAAAKHFKTSLRVTTLSMIELGSATWGLYAALPTGIADRPLQSGGVGRDRVQVRLGQYGARAFDTFATAVERDVLTEGDVLDYLDVPPEAVQEWRPAPLGSEPK